MKLSNTLLLPLATSLINANPITKRDITDADILNYALTLEHLEATFYEQGLKNYTQSDFAAAGYKNPSLYANLKRVGADEKAHEEFLMNALSAAGAKPVERCTYTFPVTDVESFLTLGSMLEGVGVSAYLGAAAHIMNTTYLSAAGSILSVEARHSAYLRASLGQIPFAQPFDNPLDFNEVYTIASSFIASCPSSNMKLPVKAFPSLTVASGDGKNAKMCTAGSIVQLMAGEGFEKMNATDVHAAFITANGPVWADTKNKADGKFMVTVPKGVAGQSYVVLTKENKQATDDSIVAGPAIIEVGMKNGDSMHMGKGMGNTSMGMMPMASSSPTMMPSSSASMSPSSPVFTGAATKGMGGSSAIAVMSVGTLAVVV